MSDDAYSEYFWRGLRLGLRGFSRDSLRAAGLKRSLGFMLQPVENWSRYPEIRQVELFLGDLNHKKVLDLGSPKMFGLLLAERYRAEFELTDIWSVAVKEVRPLVARNQAHLSGSVNLGEADLTHLPSTMQGMFDAVYSLSVVEHIEDLEGIRKGLREMARVTKSEGTVVISVPIRRLYHQAFHDEPVYGKTSPGGRAFFSHYFDAATAATIFSAPEGLRLDRAAIVSWRTQNPILKRWRQVPQKLRGLLGYLNMRLAPLCTEVTELEEDIAGAKFPEEGDLILKYSRRGTLTGNS
jgi:SAM-dependent methyltransferase